MNRNPLVREIQSTITDEIFYALGLQRRGFLRNTFGWLFHAPTRRFTRATADVEKAVEQGELPAGSVSMINFLGIQPIVDGLLNIPLSGPVIILSNHPGAYDSISIASLIPHMDVKIIVMKTRFYQALPHTHPKLIYASST